MRIDVRAVGSTVVVWIQGHLTAGTDTTCLHRLMGQVARSPGVCVVLDLAGLKRLDCAGIGNLVQIDRNLRARGGTLRLANLSDLHHELLGLVHLTKVLMIFPSVSAALEDHAAASSTRRSGARKQPVSTAAERPAIAKHVAACIFVTTP